MKKKEKQVIQPGDVVVLYQNAVPMDFVHIISVEVEGIKKGFWDVTFLRVGFPSMSWGWKLDDEQIAGEEFTIGGISYRLQVYSRPEKIVIKQEAPKGDTQPIGEEDSLF